MTAESRQVELSRLATQIEAMKERVSTTADRNDTDARCERSTISAANRKSQAAN